MQESRADHDLAEAVQAKGYPVTGRQVRRWRQEDVLPPTEVRRLGGQKGAEARYPDSALDVALGLAQALDEDRNLHRAVLVAFVRGVDVGDKALRRAYRETCSTMADKLRDLSEKGRLPEVRFRRFKRGPGRPPANEAGRHEAMAKAMCQVVLGREHDSDQLRTFLDAMGLTSGAELDETEIVRVAELATLTTVSALASKATRAELDTARDRLNSLRGGAGSDSWVDLEAAMSAPFLTLPAWAGVFAPT